LYSDGFQDQFGGPDNKKYYGARFKELLLRTSYLPSENQAASLEKEFNSWKGNRNQLDDVCIVGVKV